MVNKIIYEKKRADSRYIIAPMPLTEPIAQCIGCEQWKQLDEFYPVRKDRVYVYLLRDNGTWAEYNQPRKLCKDCSKLQQYMRNQEAKNQFGTDTSQSTIFRHEEEIEPTQDGPIKPTLTDEQLAAMVDPPVKSNDDTTKA